MSRDKASTMDADLQKVFGNPVPELYEAAAGQDASPALARALELRSFLALTEEQVARVRDRVHADMDPDRDMGELSADKLRFDAQWLEAALEARDGYRAALGGLLLTMPPPAQQERPVRTAQFRAIATLPPSAATAPQRAGAARARRP
ncbi:hypothetical protein GA0115233_103666 [Streptomyces sp. DI166]|jgi:hypothetical protein|uniref:hypothetical protein n=1 Tax=Streptomyces sp. DI166 TaxID=1839783 RepID=UPI0007F38B8E|nr:hypothetical protein [Streptomyces sp. DI166]SBT91879.1 hypothetical protein GA0115233_103666 [Streptomyces sp. DI166]